MDAQQLESGESSDNETVQAAQASSVDQQTESRLQEQEYNTSDSESNGGSKSGKIRIQRGRKPYNFNKLEGNAIVTIAKLEAQIENSTNHKEKMNLKSKLSAYRSRLQKNAKSKQQEDLLNLRNVQIEIMLGTLKQELTAEKYERIFSRMQQRQTKLH